MTRINQLFKSKVNRGAMLLLSSFLFVIGAAAPVKGSELSAFTVRAEIPENQVDKSLSYFDLRVSPGDKEIIQIEVSNSSDEEITANINIHNASTGKNGTIVYSLAEIRDESMKYSAEEIAKVITPQIVLEPNSKKMVDIELSVPEEEFDGVVLGGIYITLEDKEVPEEVETNSENNIQINNKLAYVLGLKLTETENQVTPNMNLVKIEPAVSAMRTAVNVNLQNSEAVIMKGMTIESQIFKKDQAEVLAEFKLENAEAAPNSNFDVAIDWNGNRIEPGLYRLKMKAQYEEYIWEWDEEFEINEDQSKQVNESAEDFDQEPQQTSSSSLFYLIIGILILIILMLILILFKKRSKNGESNEEEV